MKLDFRPDPQAASPIKRVTSHALMELRLFSRQGEQLLVALVIPLLVLIGGSRAGRILETDQPLNLLVPGVLALAVVASAFTSLAIGTGFERRYGVLRHLGATPLSPTGLFWGKALALAVTELFQIAVLVFVAMLLGWSPPGFAAWAMFSVAVLVGTAAFAGLALILAGTVRAEVTLGLANLFFVLAVAFGGLVLPVDRLPALLQAVAPLLPPGALGEVMRATMIGTGPVIGHLTVLFVWAVLGWLAAIRWFRWE